MLVGLFVALALLAGLADTPLLLSVSAPATIVDLDLGRLKGAPSRLAWSEDGHELYVQTAEADGRSPKLRHYLVRVGSAAPVPIDAEPAWAATYWTWKSTKTAPGDPSVSIQVDFRKQAEKVQNQSLREKAAGTASGNTSGNALAREFESYSTTTNTLHLKGQILGEWINTPIVPGETFSWSPQDLHMIAFANRKGRLVVMDREGRTQEIEGPKDVVLPAWSADGGRIAYLERTGKKRCELNVVRVARP